jgi:DeoR family ulaG and ulaABCDEF operon transcriptional repressor
MARAASVVLMVDSSKFRVPGGQPLCDLSSIHTVITDEGISEKEARMVKRAGAKLVLVNATDRGSLMTESR